MKSAFGRLRRLAGSGGHWCSVVDVREVEHVDDIVTREPAMVC
jgi:hypothetical protein